MHNTQYCQIRFKPPLFLKIIGYKPDLCHCICSLNRQIDIYWDCELYVFKNVTF